MTQYLVSVITPCFNELDNLVECHNRVRHVMSSLDPTLTYEHIFMDNASTDGSHQLLREIASTDPNVKVVINSRNIGPFRNMWEGMKCASGDAVVPLIPADLQDPPELIPQMIERWQEGDLVVFGLRETRQENAVMRRVRNIYYSLTSRFADFALPRNAGEFLLADKRVIESVLEVDDAYPYIRGLIARTGVKCSYIPYNWTRRKNGKSRNSLPDLIDQAINGFVSTSRLPARLALLFGFVMALTGIFAAVFFFILFLIERDGFQYGIPTLIVSFFFFGGMQVFFLGVIGEYVLSIHGQVRRVPRAFATEKLNF
jgi:glycosyltransferase involved in cell wall biosynthesis